MLGERPEGHLLVLERVHDGEQVRQRTAESIQFPDHKNIAGAHEFERLRQAHPVVLGTRGVILEQMTSIDADGEQRVALQVRALPIGGRSAGESRHAFRVNGA